MRSEYVAAREFVRGAASRADRVFIVSKGRALWKDEIAHTSVVSVDAGRWLDVINTRWNSTAIAIARQPTSQVVVVGEDGEVSTYLGGGNDIQTRLKPAPVMIRHARVVDGYVYACGMKRQVYRRVNEEDWVDVSAPFPKQDEKVGFEALDGFAANEIYAVGWSGEIWQFDGQKWIDRASPTNVILTAVCCAGDGVVYVAGQQGVMLRGRNEEWELIDWENDVNADLWDLCWFNNKLYVATAMALYTLEENSLAAVDFGDVGALTCFSLTTADGVLWSIGKDDVASFDGTTWRLYE
jgi:hypothetical protein